MIYTILLGDSPGPRLGSFIAIYGLDETRKLIDKALADELVSESAHDLYSDASLALSPRPSFEHPRKRSHVRPGKSFICWLP